jgi:thiamine biosynthesis lipoprotein
MRHPPFPQAESPAPSSTRRLRIALGTWVAIEARAAEHAAINAAYGAIRDVGLRMHPRREGSEIARINSTTPGTPVAVQPDTWRLLQLARRLYDLTEGVFDPCLPGRPGRLSDIEIQPNTPLLICHAPMELDLGGIAKGHAIDRAIEKLQEMGCASGLVNAGGDLRVFGDHAEEILLRRTARTSGNDPNTQFHPLTLKNAALAVSDLDATEHPVEHQGYYNRAGIAPTSIPHRYAAVIANTAAVADALTKCVLLCQSDLATRVLHEFEARPAL